ncbi:hypothetical protein E4U13_006853, partial [Claviceps humidiphila]
MAPKAPNAHKKYKRVPSTERLGLRRYREKKPHLKQAALAACFKEKYGHSVSQATVSESLSFKFKDLYDPTKRVKDDNQRNKKAHWPELEAANLIITTDLARMAATRLWNELAVYEGLPVPAFSNVWADRFNPALDL